MPSFTLIIATLGRTTELNTLFESLALQSLPDLDCLVIDQNPDDRLDVVFAHWKTRLRIRRLRCAAGVSRSRNLGLFHATGEIVAFPDDDCWYLPGLLGKVSAWFEEHSELDILTVGARDIEGNASGNRWPQERCEIRPHNAFRTTFCSSIFVRRAKAFGVSRFDEAIGPGAGTPWACGEETDYILDLIRHGARGVFDRRWAVGHPRRDMLSGTVYAGRAGGYGQGMGHVLRKQKLYFLGAAFVLYDLLRAALVLLRGKPNAARLCLHHGIGVLRGLTQSIPRNAGAQRDHA